MLFEAASIVRQTPETGINAGLTNLELAEKLDAVGWSYAAAKISAEAVNDQYRRQRGRPVRPETLLARAVDEALNPQSDVSKRQAERLAAALSSQILGSEPSPAQLNERLKPSRRARRRRPSP